MRDDHIPLVVFIVILIVLVLLLLVGQEDAMRWTKDKPTETGWYSYREGGCKTRYVVEVVKGTDGLLMFFGDGSTYMEKMADAEWAGPIPEPKE